MSRCVGRPLLTVLARSRTARAVCIACIASLVACTHPAPLPPKALELNRSGAAALAAGDLVTAEARLAVALEYNPRFTEAWVNLGLVELRRGNFEVAKKYLVRARELNPDLPAPHHALGLLADKQGRRDEAEEHYRDALAVDPGFAAARVNLGRRLFERGAYDDAREQFLRLAEVAPEMLEAWTGLVESLLRLRRDAEADETLERARDAFGDRPPLVLLDARQMIRRGAHAQAEGRLVPVTRDEERARAAEAWAWIAVARLGQENAHGAALAADEALRLDDAQPVARYALSVARTMRAR